MRSRTHWWALHYHFHNVIVVVIVIIDIRTGSISVDFGVSEISLPLRHTWRWCNECHRIAAVTVTCRRCCCIIIAGLVIVQCFWSGWWRTYMSNNDRFRKMWCRCHRQTETYPLFGWGTPLHASSAPAAIVSPSTECQVSLWPLAPDDFWPCHRRV